MKLRAAGKKLLAKLGLNKPIACITCPMRNTERHCNEKPYPSRRSHGRCLHYLCPEAETYLLQLMETESSFLKKRKIKIDGTEYDALVGFYPKEEKTAAFLVFEGKPVFATPHRNFEGRPTQEWYVNRRVAKKYRKILQEKFKDMDKKPGIKW